MRPIDLDHDGLPSVVSSSKPAIPVAIRCRPIAFIPGASPKLAFVPQRYVGINACTFGRHSLQSCRSSSAIQCLHSCRRPRLGCRRHGLGCGKRSRVNLRVLSPPRSGHRAEIYQLTSSKNVPQSRLRIFQGLCRRFIVPSLMVEPHALASGGAFSGTSFSGSLTPACCSPAFACCADSSMTAKSGLPAQCSGGGSPWRARAAHQRVVMMAWRFDEC